MRKQPLQRQQPVARGALAVPEMVFLLTTRTPQSVWQAVDHPPVAWPGTRYDTGAPSLLIAWPGNTPSTTAPSRTTRVPPTSTNLNPREGLAGAS